MRLLRVLMLLLLPLPCFAQGRLPTIANFTLRSADAAQTCIHQLNGWHEHFLPSQSCAADAVMIEGIAIGSWSLDHWLIRHNHPHWAQFQWASASGSAFGISYSLRFGFRRYQ